MLLVCSERNGKCVQYLWKMSFPATANRVNFGSKNLKLVTGDLDDQRLFIYLSLSHQIHWPVAPQRRTECVLSGKDINVRIHKGRHLDIDVLLRSFH